jgi:putative nucleotidyltransferase with HDIG domain
MKTLTIELAKKLALEYFKKYKEKVEGDFALIHTEAVAQIAVLLAKKFNLNTEIVEGCAWVHDIGYLISKENHAEHSVEILEENGFEITPIMRDCIVNHGTDGKPESGEAKVLQMADKLSILSIPVLEILFNQDKILSADIKFIEKMTGGAISFLKKLS